MREFLRGSFLSTGSGMDRAHREQIEDDCGRQQSQGPGRGDAAKRRPRTAFWGALNAR